jgi:hypothetical protein
MKYISQYNRFIKESYGENPSINWELLNTAKDLSLEYLDEGYKLCYKVYEINKYQSFIILEGSFSHDRDFFEWNGLSFDKNELIDSEKLSYTFWFVRPDCLSEYGHRKDDLYLRMANYYKLIVSQLREIYPDEKIKDAEIVVVG